jgi:hypothetical protein
LRAIELKAASFSGFAFSSGAIESSFDLGQTTGEELATLNHRNASNFEIAPTRANLSSLLFKTSTRFGHASGRRCEFVVGGFEIGKHSLEFGDARIFASDAIGEFAEVIAQRFCFGSGVTTIGFGPLQAVSRCGESRIVRVEIAGKTSFDACGVSQFGPCRFEHACSFGGDEHCFIGTTSCFVESGTSCTCTGRTDTPTAHTKSIATTGDNDGIGVRE